jgi:hypothetical protein
MKELTVAGSVLLALHRQVSGRFTCRCKMFEPACFLMKTFSTLVPHRAPHTNNWNA